MDKCLGKYKAYAVKLSLGYEMDILKLCSLQNHDGFLLS